MQHCEYFKKEAKTIITKSHILAADYVINPYFGCKFACIYCFATYMTRFVDKQLDDWGKYIGIKNNFEILLKNEIEKLLKRKYYPSIMLSSATDPYQPIEQQEKATRKILEIFAGKHYKGKVNILSKSPLVLRDIDIIKKLQNVEVGLSIAAIDEELSEALEPSAPNIRIRLNTLKQLNKNGIRTYVFIAPLLPHYINDKQGLENLLNTIKEIGTKFIFLDYLNSKPYVMARMQKFINCSKILLSLYGNYSEIDYQIPKEELEKFILQKIDKYGLKIKNNKIEETKKEELISLF